MDSRANGHVFKDKYLFSDFTPFTYAINTTNGSSSLAVKGGGLVSLQLLNKEDKPTELVLTDMAYSPNTFYNLISLSLLSKKGKLSSHWNNEIITIETKTR